MSVIIHYGAKFRRSPGSFLCRLFQAAAYDTWERIAFSRIRPRMKVHETSITQNLIYEMNLIKWEIGIPGFSVYESTNEAAHGDDIEICIRQIDGRIYKYAVQAKILYHSLRKRNMIRLDDGVYKQLNHMVSNNKQIDLLLDYARYEKAIPLYLLYNYVAARFHNGNACDINFDISQYGCSIVAAHYLKNNHTDRTGNIKSNVKFSTLHPLHAMPWFMLVCCFPFYTRQKTLDLLVKELDYTPTGFGLDAIEEDSFGWKLLGPLSEIPTNTINDFKEPAISFLPKYRLVIT